MVSDRSVYVRVKGDVSDFQRAMMAGSASAKAFTKELDTSNDRTTLLTQSLLAVGPALVPIAAAAIPAVAGLTNQLAFAAAGAGVAALAFSGIGDALKATNDYAIDPTEANLAKMKETMNELGPAGRDFVGYLQELRPQLQELQNVAQEGLLPGAQAGIEDLMSRLPQVERIVSQIATGMGELIAEAGDNLADPRWDEFFTFLETEAKPTLLDMGRTLGNFAEGFANLWMAFQPVSANFSRSFLDLSRDFSAWTDGLGETEGFQEFVDYLNRVGPKAWDTLTALGGALLQIVEAAAPVGEVMLPVIEAVADSIGAIAGSDLGPAVVGVLALTSAYARLIAVGQTVNSSAIGGMLGKSTFGGAARAAKDLPAATRAYLDFGAALDKAGPKTAGFASTNARLSASMKGVAKIAGGAGGLAFVMSDLDDKMGLSNTSMGAMAGSMLGPWGAAVGAGVGLTMDFANANDGLWQSIDRANKALGQGPDAIEQQRAAVEEARVQVDKLHDATDGVLDLYTIKGFKNEVEDIFGKSDVQEAEEAWTKAAEALAKNEDAARDARLSEAGLSESLRGTTDATRGQVDAILSLIDARNRMANEALTALDAELAYEAALDAAAEGVAKNGKSLDESLPAGRANLSLLGDLAGAWNNLSAEQQNVPGEADRMRSSFIKSAEAMGASKKRARELADELLEIPPNISTDVKVNGVGPATAQAKELNRILDILNGKVSESTVRTMYESYTKDMGKQSPGMDAFNDRPYTGMRLPSGYASGGKVPGVPPLDPTVDNVWAMGATTRQPLMVRSGEWIINEPQSEKNDPWLRAINNGLVLDDIFSRAAIPGFASGGRYEDFSALDKSSKLDLVRKQQEIRDLERNLAEREKYGKKPKKGRDTRPTRDVLRGLDRREAQLALAEARAELKAMKSDNAKLKKYGTPKQEEALRDAAEAMADAATNRMETKKSAAQSFSIGSATSAAAVDRNLVMLLTNAHTFVGLLGDLKAKGASPWLLEQLVQAGPTGGAIRLAREYATDQAKLNSINARAAQINQYADTYAGLVSNPRFMQSGAWNSGVSSKSQAPMVASLVGAEIAVGSNGLMQFVKGQIVMSQDAQAIEGRFAA